MHNTDSQIENIDEQSSLGEIKINHSVIASIVRLAALEINGVCNVGGGFVDGIAEIFSKKESDRGVKVNEDEHGYYVIEIRLVLAYGTELAKTAYNVQMAVRSRLTTMTGKNVARVDIIIDGVKTREERKEEETKQPQREWPEVTQAD